MYIYVGLETESVRMLMKFYKYDGKSFSWILAKDSSLKYAIKVSQVPAYKELAKIGLNQWKRTLKN